MRTVAHSGKIAGDIRAALERLADEDPFKNFVVSSELEEGDLVLVNNSFIYRDTVKTTKSSRYIAGKVKNGGTLSWGIVTWDRGMNVDFKKVSGRSDNLATVVDLEEAVSGELPRVGMVVFSLVGSVSEGAATEVGLSSVFKALRYDPGATDRVAADGDVLVVNQLSDPEGLWTDVIALAESQGRSDEVERLKVEFGKKIDDLRETTPRLIRLHAGSPEEPTSSLLDQIASHMQVQIAEYERALESLGSDPSDRDAYNNILRISYNFASDAIDLVTLFISICDLKPLVQWLTVAENFALAQAFRQLPFGVASPKKPSLKAYGEVISGARNHAFHDFFAFDRPFEVDLSGVTLKARRLLLFPAHRKAPVNAFDYEDRELVEVLRSFTRAPERTVSMDFWRRNLEVLKATDALARAIRDALLVLWPAISSAA